MSDGNRHHVIAYLGIGAALGFAIAAAVLEPKDQYATYAEQSGSAEPAKSAEQWAAETCAVAAQADEPESAEKQPRDLCAQFRAAAAAERSAVFDQQQVKIGWLTFGGLGMTIVVALLAWRAASSSAEADNEALRLTRKQLRQSRIDAVAERSRVANEAEVQEERFERQLAAAMSAANSSRTAAAVARQVGNDQLRAYVTIGNLRVQLANDQSFSFEVFNRGQTPARGIKAYFEIMLPAYTVLGMAPELVAPDDDLIQSTVEVGKDQSFSFGLAVEHRPKLRQRLVELRPNVRQAQFMAIVRYADVFGRFYEIEYRCELLRVTEGGRLSTAKLTSTEKQIAETVYASDPPKT